MSRVLTDDANYMAIANAIRQKNGETTRYKPGEMAAAIAAIPMGGSAVIESKNITANGAYNAPSGVDGYNPVTVNVPNSYTAADDGKVVQFGALVTQTSRTVTGNGTYDTTTNNSVVVDVEGSLDGITFSTEIPTNDKGEDGDYWYVTTPDFRAPSFTPSTNASAAKTGGLVFSAVAGTKVVGLSFFARNPVISVHLSTIDGTELARISNASATVEQWNDYKLDNPIVLDSANYVVWGSNSTDAMKYVNDSTNVGGITYIRAVYGTTKDVFPTIDETITRYGVAVIVERVKYIKNQYHKANGVWSQVTS